MYIGHTINHAGNIARLLIAVVAACFALGTPVCHAAVIDVGEHTLFANKPGQTIALQVSGGDDIAGLDMFVQIGDGGPELVNVGLPAGTDGPAIIDVDLKATTIFAATPAVQVDQPRDSVVQVFFASIALASPSPAPQTVAADGYIATLTIDTTGITSGNYDLLISSVLPSLSGGPFATQLIGSGGRPIPTTIINGSIKIASLVQGDYNSNGVVDADDYTIWRDTLGQSGSGLAADGNGDMHIDHLDYEYWKTRFGNTGTGSTQQLEIPVPEPDLAAVALVITGLSGLLRLKRP